MCFDWHVRGDCRSDECLWEYGGSERLLLVQQGLLRAAPTPVILLLALFLYFYCCDDYFCCYYGLFQGVLHHVYSQNRMSVLVRPLRAFWGAFGFLIVI